MIQKEQYKTPFYNDPEKREKHRQYMRNKMKEYRNRKDVQKKIKEYRRDYFKRPEVRARINAMRKKKD